jgi:hypothetical protein
MIVRGVRAGVEAHVAAARAGIDRATFEQWMRIGKTAFDGPYRELYDAIDKALLAREQLGH